MVVTTACTDTLGRSCEQTFHVTFNVNRPPSCTPPNDMTIDLCAPERVCLPFSVFDPDGDPADCELFAGPGEISGGQWCYTPSVSQTANVSVRCRDLCDAACVSTFNVTFRVNQPPTCAAPPDTAVVLPAPAAICRTFQASDADGDPVGCVIRSGPGSLVGNQWCGLITDTGKICVQLECTDPCGNTCTDTFCVDVAFNVAPACALSSPDSISVEAGATVAFIVTVSDPDVGDVMLLSSSTVPAAAVMNPPLPRSGPAHDVTSAFSWTPDPGQVGMHRITFAVSDDYGASGACTIVIVVLPPDPPRITSAQPSPAQDALWDRTAVFCFSEPVIVGLGAVSARSNRRGPLTGITVRYDDPSAYLTVGPPPSGWPPDDEITIVLAATITDRAGHCLDGNGDGLCEEGVPGDDFAFTFTTTLGVWPGDANGDSIVNEVDILPIARFWGLSGPSRGWESDKWEFLPAPGWEPREAARADCNSDTRVDADDICLVAEFFDSGAVAILATPKLMRLTGLSPDLREALARALQQCDRISEGTRAGLMRLLGENEHLVEPAPTGFHLAQNYPNPFNSGTVLRFSLPAAAHVHLDICDILGRVVTTLANDVGAPDCIRCGGTAPTRAGALSHRGSTFCGSPLPNIRQAGGWSSCADAARALSAAGVGPVERMLIGVGGAFIERMLFETLCPAGDFLQMPRGARLLPCPRNSGLEKAIGAADRGSAPVLDPDCPRERTDVNCDGVTTVQDVVKVVDVAFRGANKTTEFCNPCP